jgi:uncharacterized protein YidB (DUF937 family)
MQCHATSGRAAAPSRTPPAAKATDLGKALGDQTVKELAAKAGVSEEELLKQLSTALPGVVDKLTPNGNLPKKEQVAAALNAA